MNLREFREDAEQLIENFCQDFHKKRAGNKDTSMFRSEEEWKELFNTYAENHGAAIRI